MFVIVIVFKAVSKSGAIDSMPFSLRLIWVKDGQAQEEESWDDPSSNLVVVVAFIVAFIVIVVR
jgi:hypothetical protein